MGEQITNKNLEDAIKQTSSDDLHEVANGVSIAEGIEKESIDFYSRQAEKYKGQEIESFFTFLVGQEKEHLKALESLKNSLERENRWIEPSLPEDGKPEIFSKKDWDKDNSEGITAILFALWKEKQAQEFYFGISKSIKNEGAKHFFEALAEFEKHHAKMLGQYVEDSFYANELIMG